MKKAQWLNLVFPIASILFALVILFHFTEESFGYQILFTNYLLAIAYFLPIVAGLLMLLRYKYKVFGLFAFIFYVLGVVLLLSQVGESIEAKPIVIISAILGSVLIFLMFYILNGENIYSVRDIVETAMLVALAVGLDLPGLKIRIGVSGGSISFTMLPLFILALRLGTFKGFIGCGVIYGTITCFLDGWGFYSFPFDYLFGYGSICVVGLFYKLIFPEDGKLHVKGFIFLSVGVVSAIALRLLSATISGVIYYETPFLASLSYNALYILPSGGICLAAILALYKPLLVVNQRFPNKITTL